MSPPRSTRSERIFNETSLSSCCKLRVHFRKVFLISVLATGGTKFNENLFILKAGISSPYTTLEMDQAKSH